MKNIIEHAVKGGYWFPDVPKDAKWDIDSYDKIGIVMITWDADIHLIGSRQMSYEQVYFSHDFLKGFFGEVFVCPICGKKILDNCKHTDTVDHIPSWQYHSCNLVLAEDRFLYLRGFLNENMDN